MKKKLFALSGVFLIVLVVTGLWATKAIDLMGVIGEGQNPLGETSLVNGMTMQEMTAGASVIVVGKCLETRSQWVEGRRLFTLATVSVVETLKGEPTATLTVALPGGIDSNRKHPIAMTFAGAPQMSPEDDVILFLTNEGEVANSYAVMGFTAGKFAIAETNDGVKVVTRDQTRMRVENVPGMTRGNPQFIPLAEFKELVRSYLR